MPSYGVVLELKYLACFDNTADSIIVGVVTCIDGCLEDCSVPAVLEVTVPRVSGRVTNHSTSVLRSYESANHRGPTR